MFASRWTRLGIISLIAAIGLGSPAFAQRQPGPTGVTVSQDPMKAWEEARAQAEQQVKDALGANDDEWKVLKPKLEKVDELTAQSGGGNPVFYRKVDRSNLPDVIKKRKALSELLANKDATTEQIARAMKEYREARAKAKEELAKAQKELKELLTINQEAQLVLKGMIE